MNGHTPEITGDDMKRRDFSNTIAALAEYDKTAVPKLEVLFDRIITFGDYEKWETAERDARVLVQRAFHEDTKDLNDWSHCKMVNIKDARRIASHVGSKKTPRLDPMRHIPN